MQWVGWHIWVVVREAQSWDFLWSAAASKNVKNVEKNARDDGEPQITTAAPGVNSWPQEAKVGAFEPPSPQEKKPQGGAMITIR